MTVLKKYISVVIVLVAVLLIATVWLGKSWDNIQWGPAIAFFTAGIFAFALFWAVIHVGQEIHRSHLARKSAEDEAADVKRQLAARTTP